MKNLTDNQKKQLDDLTQFFMWQNGQNTPQPKRWYMPIKDAREIAHLVPRIEPLLKRLTQYTFGYIGIESDNNDSYAVNYKDIDYWFVENGYTLVTPDQIRRWYGKGWLIPSELAVKYQDRIPGMNEYLDQLCLAEVSPVWIGYRYSPALDEPNFWWTDDRADYLNKGYIELTASDIKRIWPEPITPKGENGISPELMQKLKDATSDKYREGHEALKKAYELIEGGADYAVKTMTLWLWKSPTEAWNFDKREARNHGYVDRVNEHQIPLSQFIEELLQMYPEPKERAYRHVSGSISLVSDNHHYVIGNNYEDVGMIWGLEKWTNEGLDGEYQKSSYTQTPVQEFKDKLNELLTDIIN